MTGNEHHSNGRRLRKPLSEADVLAVVEQVADPSETIGASNDARLAERLRQMRLDRDALTSLGDDPAPAGLFAAAWDEAQSLSERELLIGLSDGSRAERFVESKVLPMRDRLVDRVFDRPVRWLVAAAATLLLMLGVGAFLLAKSIGSGSVSTVGPLAAGPEVSDSSLVSPNGPAAVAIADEPEELSESARRPTRSVIVADARERLDSEAVVAERTAVASLADAAELLASRRLAVRAVLRGADGAERLAAAMASRPSSDLLLAGDDVRGALLPSPIQDRPEIVVAGEGGSNARTVDRRIEREAWVVQSVAEPTALAGLRAALEAEGFEVHFEQLAEPLSVTLTLTPDAMAWWSQPPRRWSAMAPLPVVVEQKH